MRAVLAHFVTQDKRASIDPHHDRQRLRGVDVGRDVDVEVQAVFVADREAERVLLRTEVAFIDGRTRRFPLARLQETNEICVKIHSISLVHFCPPAAAGEIFACQLAALQTARRGRCVRCS